MLIKPWTDIQAPRHYLDDEGEESTPHLVPEIAISVEDDSIETVLVCPQTIKVIVESIAEKTQIGSVEVKYPQIKDTEANEDDYDEDEQLYAAIMKKSLDDAYTEFTIPIYKHVSTALLVVPQVKNTVVFNLLAAKLAAAFPHKNWITLAPCALNNNQTLNRFGSSNDILSGIPEIRPPHFITGVAAAVSARVSLSDASLVTLVLNAEGQSGFEKLDSDSIVDAAHVVGALLGLGEPYLKNVSLAVRKFNSYSNSGMYI